MKLFSGSDVVKTLGISQKLLTQWFTRELIVPTKKARGPGDKNEFTLTDIVRISIMRELANSGLSRRAAADIAFCPVDNPTGVAFAKILDRVIESYRQPTTLLGGRERVLMAFFRDADGNIWANDFSNDNGLRNLYHLFLDYETATIINISKLAEHVTSVLGTE
jgi:DNA-binding transcriptional MerR regulator